MPPCQHPACRWTEGTDSQGHQDKQPIPGHWHPMEQQQLSFHDQGGRRLAETNLFLALSASLGPIFGIFLFFPPKNPTENLIWTKTRADCISSQFHSQPVCLSPLPRRGPGTSTPGSSRQPRLPSQDPAQQGLGTSSIRKGQVCPSISLFQL